MFNLKVKVRNKNNLASSPSVQDFINTKCGTVCFFNQVKKDLNVVSLRAYLRKLPFSCIMQ